MAEICPVCEENIGILSLDEVKIQGLSVHGKCRKAFIKNPEKYGGKAIKKTEAQINLEKEDQEQQHQQEEEEKAVYKSVQIKGGVDINSFDMPFGDMVEFMVKWALASIPAFFILAIIGAIFFAIFGALFF